MASEFESKEDELAMEQPTTDPRDAVMKAAREVIEKWDQPWGDVDFAGAMGRLRTAGENLDAALKKFDRPRVVERTEYDYRVWRSFDQNGPIRDWLDEYGEVGFRFVSHVSVSDIYGDLHDTVIMERAKVRQYGGEHEEQ